MRYISIFKGLLGLLVGVSLISCAGPTQPARAQKGQMDTPEFHQMQGDKHLMQGDYESAKRSYSLAIELDAAHANSESGLAVALAYLGSGNVSDHAKQKVYDRGSNLISSALDHSETKSQQARTHSNAVRFYVILKRPQGDWYGKAKGHFEDAIDLSPTNPEPYFFMASAEAGNRNYEGATQLYKKVLSIGGAYEVEADQQLQQIQKIQRALPGSRFGAQIANLEAITRADTAALLLAELRLDHLFLVDAQQDSASFRPPAGQRRMKVSSTQMMPDATDLTGHPLKSSVEMVIKLGLKGLEPDAGHKFNPSAQLTRAEFAMIIQSILAKITHDNELESQFIGEPSPFTDVQPSRWYYNAVRTAVSRGLMQPMASGKFKPMGTVSGADALLAVRNLQSLTKGSTY